MTILRQTVFVPIAICMFTVSVSALAIKGKTINGLGDGDTAPDWQITGPLQVNLRAERAGQGQGRVYKITVSCSEAGGLNSAQTTTVTVPHDQSKSK